MKGAMCCYVALSAVAHVAHGARKVDDVVATILVGVKNGYFSMFLKCFRGKSASEWPCAESGVQEIVEYKFRGCSGK